MCVHVHVHCARTCARCVCVLACVLVCIHAYVCMHTCALCICMCLPVCWCAYVHACVLCVHAHMCVHALCTCVCLRARRCACAYCGSPEALRRPSSPAASCSVGRAQQALRRQVQATLHQGAPVRLDPRRESLPEPRGGSQLQMLFLPRVCRVIM